MTNANYILGTVEYVTMEIECTTPGFVFTPADWSAVVTLVSLDDVFDDDAAPSIWSPAYLEEVGGKNYAKVLLGDDPDLTPGRYRMLVRLTKTVGGTEIPLLRARGEVLVEVG